MTRISRALLVLAGATVLSASAMALTITNVGTTPQELTIKVDDEVAKVILQPNESRDHLCAAPKGCVISHVSGDEFPLKGNEDVEVDDSGLSIPE